MSARVETLLVRLPALLLVGVALHQIVLARTADLNAWSGGGFGMFSTTDAWGRRHVHAWALADDGGRRELEIPEELEHEESRTLALPDERRLRALAYALAEAAAAAEPGAPVARAIEIQVFAKRYDPHSLGASGELLAALVVPLEEH